MAGFEKRIRLLQQAIDNWGRWTCARPIVMTPVLSVFLRNGKFRPWYRVHKPYGKNMVMEVGLLMLCVLVSLPIIIPPKPLRDGELTKAS